ncbi:MAG: transglycosylase SLT domain-containing protein [Gemmatimonadetes bacterium]|nr:transglycosylase SLT domain-containing protein [Gemmatimonadota bacterium]
MGGLKTHLRAFLLGLALTGLAGLTAWAVGREEPVEPAPMDELRAEEPESRVHWDLPVTYNDRVEHWVKFLAGENRERTRLWLERSGTYAPMIRGELRKRGMPEDLVYLAFIESGFSPKAYSRAKASGLWQFIAETGRILGLEVSSYVDERRDPLAATDAALRFLNELYHRFGSWYLAAAAYNTGPNRVARILKERTGKTRGTDATFWQIAPYLPRETRNYVPLMLAAGHIAKEPWKYGFDELDYGEPLSYDTVRVPGGTPLAAVAKAAGVAEPAVEELNPHLVKGRTPPGRSWAVRIPAGAGARFAAEFPRVRREARLAEAKAATVRAASRVHRVRRGDTLWDLARHYDVSVAQLRRWNGLHGSRLLPGQRLRVGG